jgi:hypothetical protein
MRQPTISVESRYCTRGPLYRGARRLPPLNDRSDKRSLVPRRAQIAPLNSRSKTLSALPHPGSCVRPGPAAPTRIDQAGYLDRPAPPGASEVPTPAVQTRPDTPAPTAVRWRALTRAPQPSRCLARRARTAADPHRGPPAAPARTSADLHRKPATPVLDSPHFLTGNCYARFAGKSGRIGILGSRLRVPDSPASRPEMSDPAFRSALTRLRTSVT